MLTSFSRFTLTYIDCKTGSKWTFANATTSSGAAAVAAAVAVPTMAPGRLSAQIQRAADYHELRGQATRQGKPLQQGKETSGAKAAMEGSTLARCDDRQFDKPQQRSDQPCRPPAQEPPHSCLMRNWARP